MRKTLIALLFLATFGVAAAYSQQEVAPRPPACTTLDQNLEGGLEAWRFKTSLAAAREATQLASAELQLGAAVKAGLVQTRDIDYPVRPEKPGGSVSYGGLFAFNVVEPGTYRVALSTAAWVEVVKNGTTIAAAAFGHGPDCTTIRKIVEFRLQTGLHIFEIAGNGANSVDILVVQKSER